MMSVTALVLLNAAFAQDTDADTTEENAEETTEDVAPTTPDRSTPPPVTPPVALDLPEVTTHEIRPGLAIEHLQIPGIRKVQIQLLFHHGSQDLCGGSSPECSMLFQIWDHASTEMDSTALMARLDELDGRITSWGSLYDSGLDMSIPRNSLDEGLQMMTEVLHNPAFDKGDFKRSQSDFLDWYTFQAPNDISTVAGQAKQYAWYPADFPRGARPDVAGLDSLGVGELAPLHQTLLETSPVTLQIIGDVAWEDVQEPLVAMLEGIGVEADEVQPPPLPPTQRSLIVAVDMPGQSQAAIRAVYAGPSRTDDARVPATTVNFALGGSFTSRLNGNLREDKGWTYGAYSGLSKYPTHGTWNFSVDVEAENVGAAIGEVQNELSQMASDGCSDEEIHSAWLDTVTWWNRRLETDQTAAGFYQGLSRRAEPAADVAARLAAAHDLTGEQTQAAADQLFGADAHVLWVVVGDRSAIESQIAALDIETVWISAEQAVLGTFETELR